MGSQSDNFECSLNVMSALSNLLKNNPAVKTLSKIYGSLEQIKKNTEVSRMAAANPYLAKVREFSKSTQLSFTETVDLLIKERISFARFGDGELKLMLRPTYKLAFQKNSEALRQALAEVIELGKKAPKQLFVGFPQTYQDLHWSGVWVDIADETLELFAGIKRVGNAHVTRPIFFEDLGQVGVDLWRAVWAGKKVRVVTGKGSRFELTPALFDNVASVEYSYSTATNGFEDLARMHKELAETKDELYLIALGPAGTVLAAQLAAQGKWAIDLGHISDSYENVFKGAVRPELKPVAKN
jgi:Glycosyltransferase GT-D fold